MSLLNQSLRVDPWGTENKGNLSIGFTVLCSGLGDLIGTRDTTAGHPKM